MIKVYLLLVETIDGKEVVTGIDLIHDAILQTTYDPLIRKLIMDTTPDEDTALTQLAIGTHYATDGEVALYNAHVVISTPDPDTIRVEELLTSSPDVINQPEMWELMRLIGKRLGYRFD